MTAHKSLAWLPPQMAVKSRRRAAATIASRLTLEKVTRRFGRVDGASAKSISTLQPGEIVALLGHSGCGKTTLLRIAAGVDVPTSGRVLLDEREVASPKVFVPPEKRSIGLMFQDYALFPHLTVLKNVMFGLTALDRRARAEEARAALARVGLAHLAESYPHEISGGEQQRVALARAIVPRPGVLLMDEPFSGLDSRLRDSVRADTLSILRETERHGGHRHPRSGRGDADERPHRADARRPDRSGGRSGGTLRPAEKPLRGALLQRSERDRRLRLLRAGSSPASPISPATATRRVPLSSWPSARRA